MNKLKNIIIILFVLLSSLYVGITIYKNKKVNADISNIFRTIYLVQYGVYSDKNNMIENGSKLSNYFYYEDKDGYHIIIGITSNKDLSNKIKNAFGIETEIYIKEKTIKNGEFYVNLTEYDKLIEGASSPQTIISAEKQILGKYEELVIYE